MINLIQHFINKKKQDGIINDESSDNNINNIFDDTDFIEFPSEGIFYPNNQSKIKVRKLNFLDENILTKESYYIDNTIWKELINNVIDKEEILTYDDLLPVDVEAIIIWLRATSFGSEYSLSNIKCPICQTKSILRWDLNETTFNTINQKYVDVLKEFGAVPFNFSENITIGISIPNMNKVREVDIFIKNLEKGTGKSFQSTKDLLYIISHIEDNTENKEEPIVSINTEDIYTKLLTINLSIQKTKELKKISDKINMYIELKTDFNCKGYLKDIEGNELLNSEEKKVKCNYKEEDINLSFGRDFFLLKEEN